MIGQTISHYKILEKLGEGGMGVVYKCEDTLLKRTVALKFLPRGLETHDVERARFLQEAQAASALNHPNVSTIHEIGEHEGQQFLVMEFVDGATLKERIEDGGLKLQNCITYAIQIGEALHEAHTHGIVHRDIKAENIMVNAKNQVKVMDFGLAKLKGSLKLTKTSSTVGTLAYMAPEQIEGGEVDARSDIFSFGVVLYEMLTGHTPFRGEHEAAMVYSIVNEEPTPIQKHLPEVSSELVHILNRALEKDPEDRYQTVHDMVIDLRRLRKQTSRVSRVIPALEHPGEPAVTGEESAQASSYRPRWLSTRWVVLAPVATAVVIVAGFYLLFVRSSLPKFNPRMTTRVIEIPFAEIGYPTLSSDGKWIAFAAADTKGTWDFYFMHTRSPEVKRVTFDSVLNFANQCIDFSPDGSRIAYDHAGIYVASPLTGESRRIVDSGYGPIWRSDGERIGFLRWGTRGRTGGITGKPEFWSIHPDGSDKRLEFADTASTFAGRLCCAWSPDLKSVAHLSTRGRETEEVYVRGLRDGSDRQLTHMNSAIDNVRWARNGWILFSSNKSGTTNLWMISPDGGEPMEFTKGTSPYIDVGMSADCKTFLGYQRTQVSRMWIANLDGTETRPVSTDEQLYLTPSFSFDDRQIVFTMGSGDPLSGVMHVYLMDRDGQRRRQIISATSRFPIMSPDGKWIAYSGFGKGGYTAWITGLPQCYVVDVANPTDVRHVGENRPISWLDNQSFLAFRFSTFSGWQTFVDGHEQKRLSPDSTMAFPLQAGRQVLVIDLRAASQGLYIGPAGSGESQFPKNLRLIRSFKPSWRRWAFFLSPMKTFVLLRDGQLRLWRIALPSCTEERIQSTFPEFGVDAPMSISNDGRFVVYAGMVQTKSKLVLMEDPFE